MEFAPKFYRFGDEPDVFEEWGWEFQHLSIGQLPSKLWYKPPLSRK